MTEQLVQIQLAAGAPSCELWDGRKARQGVVLTVTAEEAATLMERDPGRWVFSAAKKGKE